MDSIPVTRATPIPQAARARPAVHVGRRSIPPGGSQEPGAAGIETGEIVVPEPAAALQDVVTETVLTAAGRLQQAADDAEVIVGPAAARLLRGTVILRRRCA